MNYKIKGLLILTLIFVLAFSFSTQALEIMSIGTAPAGGAWYGIGGALADVITKNVDGVIANAEVTGAALDNVKLLGNEEIELGFTINAIAKQGYEGKPPFSEEYSNIRMLVSSIQRGYCQIVTTADKDMKYVSDLKGKRVAVGPSGHGSLIRLKEIFANAGFTFDDIDPVYLPYSQSLRALGDKKVDAAVLYVAPPAPAIKEFSVSHDIKLLGLKEENKKEILEKYPHYLSVEIPANTYKGFDETVSTVATANVIMVDKALDEDLVYNITKSIFENIDNVKAGHPSAKDFNINVATEGASVPFHPGAIKYFKEQGIWED